MKTSIVNNQLFQVLLTYLCVLSTHNFCKNYTFNPRPNEVQWLCACQWVKMYRLCGGGIFDKNCYL